MSSSLLSFFEWLQETSVSVGFRESTWTYPVIESAHVLGLCLFLGFAMLWDLRLLNVTLRRVPVSDVQARVTYTLEAYSDAIANYIASIL